MNPAGSSNRKHKQQLNRSDNQSSEKELEAFNLLVVSSPGALQANMEFFEPATTDQSPHSTSYSWKSTGVRRAEEFARVKRLVKLIAPEQFENPARPTNSRCQIMPTSVLKYVEHKRDVLAIAMHQAERNLASRKEAERVMNIKAAGEVQRPIRSRLGAGGVVFKDGLSPVLCQPTMWSAEYDRCQFQQSRWPSLAELQECGDKRENNQIATRCGRYLPVPHREVSLPQYGCTRAQKQDSTDVSQIKKFLLFDEPGPIFVKGPRPVEIIHANFNMDRDDDFEARAKMLLGQDMMDEVGKKRRPYVPAWLAQRRHEEDGRRVSILSMDHTRRLLPCGIFQTNQQAWRTVQE